MTAADHAARRARLRERLEGVGLDAIVTSFLPNVRWLSGFTGSNATLLVAADPEGDLIVTDGRYQTQVADQSPDLTSRIQRENVLETVVGHLSDVGLGRLAFEADRIDWESGEKLRAVADESGVETVPEIGHVEHLRQFKDAAEIAALREACAITSDAFDELLGWLAPGMTEREVGIRLDRKMVDLGADGPSFETIVASGPNSAIPHHRPTARVLERGDLVKIDFGALYEGYHADMTRTVALGDPGERLREIHDLVRRSQHAGTEAVAAGIAAAEVDATCREIIAEAGHGDDFLHSTGHGVGLEIHEQPTVSKTGDATLEEQMTVTVEPGVYIAGEGGVRIEDTVVVRESSPPDVLTTSPRELIVL
jgi:Xaa-Pro aminopeptidase